MAQVVTFTDIHIPATSLESFNAFYIYSQQDAPGIVRNIPSVSFTNVKAEVHLHEPFRVALGDPRFVKVGIAPYVQLTDSSRRWCTSGSYSPEALTIMPFTGESTITHTIGKTDIYSFYVSNCYVSPVVVNVTVTVKQAYGFLPGSDYPKMTFYFWLTIAYLALGIAWGILSLIHRQILFNIQHCIGGAIGLGLFEAVLFYRVFAQWNVVGNRPTSLLVFATLVSVVKTIFSYVLLWMTSLGWGITRATIEKNTMVKIVLVVSIYTVIDFICEVVVAILGTASYSVKFVLFCVLPVSILNGAMCYWIFTAIRNLTRELKAEEQTTKLTLFHRLSAVLICGIVCTVFLLLLTLHDIAKNVPDRWQYQWIQTDGVSHALFFVILTAMMFLLAPHKDSPRYCYSVQIATTDTDLTGVVMGNPDEVCRPVFEIGNEDSPRGDDRSAWREVDKICPGGVVSACDSDEDL